MRHGPAADAKHLPHECILPSRLPVGEQLLDSVHAGPEVL
eukprot:CAMPEP_0119091306 /NCGR_PEP_ID=MMETSP1178-20130426/155838_1 /TAXON_ID=33656 /ORGANISM="unid sp, Strain CCMP2000" /LENGTH=39 /DNA_ID= /DNA_START= /DNA_END= /DNA_ORIENTATION=